MNAYSFFRGDNDNVSIHYRWRVSGELMAVRCDMKNADLSDIKMRQVETDFGPPIVRVHIDYATIAYNIPSYRGSSSVDTRARHLFLGVVAESPYSKSGIENVGIPIGYIPSINRLYCHFEISRGGRKFSSSAQYSYSAYCEFDGRIWDDKSMGFNIKYSGKTDDVRRKMLSDQLVAKIV